MSCHEVAFLSDLKTISFAGRIHPLILTKIQTRNLMKSVIILYINLNFNGFTLKLSKVAVFVALATL